ncbi:hypothetical protein ABTM86_19830, partial [Acinetobacter baumannii]
RLVFVPEVGGELCQSLECIGTLQAVIARGFCIELVGFPQFRGRPRQDLIGRGLGVPELLPLAQGIAVNHQDIGDQRIAGGQVALT